MLLFVEMDEPLREEMRSEVSKLSTDARWEEWLRRFVLGVFRLLT